MNLRPKKLALWLLLTSSAQALSAQESTLLWKVTGKDLEAPSYLLGTIHMICADYRLPDKVPQTLAAATKVMFELDMDDPRLASEMQKHAINPEMKNFREELSAQDAQAIDAFLTRHYGANLSQLGIMKPIAVLSMIIMKSTPCSEVQSVEQLLVNEAKKRAKPIEGLETVAHQMRLFDEVPLTDQLGWLTDAVTDKYLQTYRDMMQAYRDENLEELEEVTLKSPGMENYMDLLLYSRNQAWIPKMEKEMKSQSVFFAVGAGHLPGSLGVISLLRDRGYTVEPVE